MDKETAALMIKATLLFSEPLDVLFDQVDALPEGEEKSRIKKAAGDVMAALTRDIIFPIVSKYPELDPDK